MTARTTVLLVSPRRSTSGALIWPHRHLFSPAEVHVQGEDGRFLTAEQARSLVPWAEEGLTYGGTLLDALEARRVGLVVPLVEPQDGKLSAFWEFLGVPFVGCRLTGLVLASEAGVHSSNQGGGEPVAWVGGPQPTVVCPGVPEAEVAVRERISELGLEGWGLAWAKRQPSGWAINRIDMHPDLATSPFLNLLQTHGVSLEALLLALIEQAHLREGRDAALKHHYRDRV